MQRRHLILSLSRATFGRAALGVTLAQQLQARGDAVTFLAHEELVPLFAQATFHMQPISNEMMRLAHLYVDSWIADSYHSIIVTDPFTYHENGAAPTLPYELLERYGIPVIPIDTWDSAESGSTIDLFLDEQQEVPRWIERVPHKLLPVPIIRPVAKAGAYCSLPEPTPVPKAIRNYIRKNLGLAADDRVIMFCTGRWQHRAADVNPDAARIATALPLLLARVVERLGPSVHLVHVGPASYPLEALLGDRYKSLTAMPSDSFDLLVGSVDLMVFPNASAATVGKAIVMGRPTVIIENSCRATTLDEVEAHLGGPASPFMRTWLRDALPIFPFVLWPLGYHKFLAPVLRDNAYATAYRRVEMLDEEGLVLACHDLLFDRGACDRLADHQERYVRQARALPTGADVVSTFLCSRAR